MKPDNYTPPAGSRGGLRIAVAPAPSGYGASPSRSGAPTVAAGLQPTDTGEPGRARRGATPGTAWQTRTRAARSVWSAPHPGAFHSPAQRHPCIPRRKSAGMRRTPYASRGSGAGLPCGARRRSATRTAWLACVRGLKAHGYYRGIAPRWGGAISGRRWGNGDAERDSAACRGCIVVGFHWRLLWLESGYYTMPPRLPEYFRFCCILG